jgi:hypothetical protein
MSTEDSTGTLSFIGLYTISHELSVYSLLENWYHSPASGALVRHLADVEEYFFCSWVGSTPPWVATLNV